MRGLETWKVAIAMALAIAVVLSIRARAPRRAVARVDLRRLVLSALMLYAVGALAWLTHHRGLAGGVYAAGIMTAALAAWLSRGRDSEDPRGGSDRRDQEPPFSPDRFGPDHLGPEQFDWASFERDFRAYSEGRCEPAGLD